MNHHSITLNGGLLLTVEFEKLPDGSQPAPQEIKIRQIPVREYEAGFPLVDDEAGLVGFLCARERGWALTLQPAAFETVLEKGREVNARGFFSFCQRRMERLEKQNVSAISAMAALPPEMLRQVMELGQAKVNASRSPFLPPVVPPPSGR